MSKVGQKLRDKIKNLQNYSCAMCGISEDGFLILQVHHVLPTSQGGSDEESNLVALCPNCHCRTHSILEKAKSCN
jgi:5-methylcytosine-specific restriction protein A